MACRYHGSNVTFRIHALCFMSWVVQNPYYYPLIPGYLLDMPFLTTETRISPSRRSNILLIWATSFEHGKNTIDVIWSHQRLCRFLMTVPSVIFLLRIYWQHLPLLRSLALSPQLGRPATTSLLLSKTNTPRTSFPPTLLRLVKITHDVTVR